jgi:hypothetical protein
VLDFVSLQTDRNSGNFLFRREPGHEGREEYAMTPIDAGRSMHKTEYCEAGLTGAFSTTGYADRKGAYTHGEQLIPQLPQARVPLGKECLDAIGRLDPDAMKAQMENGYNELTRTNPQLKGTVDPSCFENMRRSALFLKVAAGQGPVTVAELGRAYANGVIRLLKMEPFDEKAFRAEAAKIIGLAKQYEALGGAEKLAELGYNPKDKQFDNLENSVALLSNPKETDEMANAKGVYDEALQTYGAALPELLPKNPPPAFILEMSKKFIQFNGIGVLKEVIDLGGVAKMLRYGGVLPAKDALSAVRNYLKAIHTFESSYGTGAEAKVKRLARYNVVITRLDWNYALAKDVNLLDEYDKLGGDAKFEQIKEKAGLNAKSKLKERVEAMQKAAPKK